jgi:hypothetical protein
MRLASISSTVGGSGSNGRHRLPKEGTKLRRLYDYFQEHKGEAVHLPDFFKPASTAGVPINQLKDFYGCDIRSRPDPTNSHFRLYCLVGEWHDKTYLNYSKEKVNA